MCAHGHFVIIPDHVIIMWITRSMHDIVGLADIKEHITTRITECLEQEGGMAL